MERYLNILFAAVQLASHTSTLELLDVVDFVDALKPYVSRIIRNLHLQRELYKANGSRRLFGFLLQMICQNTILLLGQRTQDSGRITRTEDKTIA